MSFDPEKITFFAKTDARGANVPFGIKAKDRTRHVYVIGKTGMGKSTLLENMAVQDIKNGEGLAFIDPHGATAETLLEYIPEERKKDVLYFAPFDAENPVAFNVMEDVGPDKRHLVVSGLMSVFKKIWVDAWSARMEYILQNTLLALLEYPDSTLLGVNRMLSEKHFRKKVIDNISDPAVKSFWVDEFLNYNERYMQEAGDAIKNKIGQFTANPLIRNIIGQPKSSFDIREIMDERKILIMNLSKGLVGESNANLLGSMLTTRIYLAAMSRADLSQRELDQTPNFYFYVDEFQSFANATFADILSEARKYKLNLTIAHQYIEQMEEEVRNAVFGNVGTIVSFRVGPFDAEVLETIFAPQFYAVDICNLGFAQVYLTLMIDGIGSTPFSATTLPPIERPHTSCKDIVINESRAQFSKTRSAVEEAIKIWHEPEAGQQQKNQNQSQRQNSNNGGNGKKFNGTHTDRFKQGSPGLKENGGRKDFGEKKDSRPRQNGGGDSKSLDELRAVLAGISNKSNGNNGGKKEGEKVQKQPEKKKESGNRSDPAQDLKATLASVLGNTGTHTEQKKEEEKPTEIRPKKDVAQQKKRVEPKPQVVSQTSVQSSKTHEGAHTQSTQNTQDRIPDPLDPKKLERMMKPKSSDRTPLK